MAEASCDEKHCTAANIGCMAELTTHPTRTVLFHNMTRKLVPQVNLVDVHLALLLLVELLVLDGGLLVLLVL